MLEGLEDMARDEVDASTARKLIWLALDREDGHRSVYSALCRWTWRTMVERRVDDELKVWHRLLLDVAGRLAAHGADAQHAQGRPRLGPVAAAERIRGLADIVKISIDAAVVTAMVGFAARAHVGTVLGLLASHHTTYLSRGLIRTQTGLGNANLSRLLSLLALQGAIERRSKGKEAEFKITPQGLEILRAGGGGDGNPGKNREDTGPTEAFPEVSTHDVKVTLPDGSFCRNTDRVRERALYEPINYSYAPVLGHTGGLAVVEYEEVAVRTDPLMGAGHPADHAGRR